MDNIKATVLELDHLYPKVRALTKPYADFIKENCMVCLDLNGHSTDVLIIVLSETGEISTFQVTWSGMVTEEIRRAYVDTRRATDNAACGIALLLLHEITEYVAISQSATGTTIDYYLGLNSHEETYIFNNAARLEVSGILTANEKNTIEDRIKEKLDRLIPEDDLPDFVIVVDFGKPKAKWVRR